MYELVRNEFDASNSNSLFSFRILIKRGLAIKKRGVIGNISRVIPTMYGKFIAQCGGQQLRTERHRRLRMDVL